MGWLRELRSSLENPSTPLSFPAEWLLDMFNGGRTDSGIRVSEMTALQVSTVFACVDLISGVLAALPLNVYESLGADAMRIADDQNLHWLLHQQPNPEMTSFTFRKVEQVHALLWGNGFAEIQRDKYGRPIAMWPRDPYQTRPRRATVKMAWIADNGETIVVEPGELFYVTQTRNADPNGGSSERFIAAGDMLHVPGLSLDGRLGRSTIEMARQAIGLSLAAEKFGGKFFANGLRPSGIVELPQDLAPQAVENYKRSLQEAYGGENMMRPMVLENGMKWTQSTVTPNEAQFLELRVFQKEEICSIFRVPPHMVGASDKSNRANTEQLGIEFTNYTMRPWTVPWEQEFGRKLFPQVGRSAGKYFAGFDLEDLLLPDAESRGKYFTMLKQWGIANSNDVRKKLRWNPIAGRAGNDYWMPVNMQDASNPMSSSAGGGATGGGAPDPANNGAGNDDFESDRYANAYRAIFSAVFGKILSRQKVDSDLLYRSFAPVLTAIGDGIAINAAPLLGLDARSEAPAEVAGFVREYCGAMFERLPKWKADAGALDSELRRAVRAMKIAVCRELGVERAKAGETNEGAPAQ